MPKEKRVVPEDYFRVLKERREVEKNGAKMGAAKSYANIESIDSNRNHSPERHGMPYWL